MRVLARESGTTVPANLARLEQKEVKHKQVIAPAEMRNHLLKTLTLS
jgi:hypothetical protein